jgi:preprotein translocase subunit SecA
MMDGIKEESVAFLFNLEVQVEEEPAEAPEDADADGASEEPDEGLSRLFQKAPVGATTQPVIRAKGLEEKKKAPSELTYTAPSETGDTEVRREAASTDDRFATVGRNDLCPCGSGKKYKRCHGAPGGPSGQTARVG